MGFETAAYILQTSSTTLRTEDSLLKCFNLIFKLYSNNPNPTWNQTVLSQCLTLSLTLFTGLNPNQYGQCLTLIIIEKRSVTHVTMLAKYNDNRELKQQRWEGNENYQKIDSNLASTSRFFVHFFASLHGCDMKLPNLTRPLYAVGEHNEKKFSFSFS